MFLIHRKLVVIGTLFIMVSMSREGNEWADSICIPSSNVYIEMLIESFTVYGACLCECGVHFLSLLTILLLLSY